MAATLDQRILAAAFGMDPEAALYYNPAPMWVTQPAPIREAARTGWPPSCPGTISSALRSAALFQRPGQASGAIIGIVSGAKTTAEQLERTVASLRGLRIEQVAYAVPTGGADGREPGRWDQHAWHEPALGCQLTTHIGVTFTLVWNNSFGSHGLEAFDEPINRFLAATDQPYGTAVLPVDDHPRWSHLRDREIVDTELAWIDWVSGHSTPVWARLDLAPRTPDQQDPDSVWFAAGRWTNDHFAIPTDHVTVIFDKTEAVRARLARA